MRAPSKRDIKRQNDLVISLGVRLGTCDLKDFNRVKTELLHEREKLQNMIEFKSNAVVVGEEHAS
jgi:hypothetical protein